MNSKMKTPSGVELISRAERAGVEVTLNSDGKLDFLQQGKVLDSGIMKLLFLHETKVARAMISLAIQRLAAESWLDSQPEDLAWWATQSVSFGIATAQGQLERIGR